MEEIFEAVETEVKFEKGFHNGTGYFDHATLPDGVSVAKTKDELGRRLVIIRLENHKKEQGILVVHDRYADNDYVQVFSSTSMVGRAFVNANGGPTLGAEGVTILKKILKGETFEYANYYGSMNSLKLA